MRSEITATRRSRTSLILLIGVVVLLFLPLSRSVSVPAVLTVENEAEIFPTRPARLVAIHVARGDVVQAGARLATLEDRDLMLERNTAGRRLALLDTRLNRIIADPQERAAFAVLQRQKVAEADRVAGLDRQIAQLEARAPFDGIVVDVPSSVHPGRAVGRETMLLRMHDGGPVMLSGMVRERDVDRLATGATGRFVPDDPARAALPIAVERIATTALSAFEEPALASPNGGPVVAKPGGGDAPVPHGSHYAIRMRPQGDVAGPIAQTVRGVATVEADARSLAGRFARRVVALLVRESGF